MPRSNWNLKVLVFKKREKPAYPERTLGREPRTNSTRIWHTFVRTRAGPHWWEKSALTTAPPLLPFIALLQGSVCRSMIFYKCLGWAGFVTSAQSQEKERAHAGLTSDISIVSLAFDGKTFSRLKFLHLPRLFFDSNIQLNQC